MAECLALELLRSGNWGEDSARVSSFLASPYCSLLEEALGSLKRESLYKSHVHGVGHIERTMVHGAMCAWAEGLGEADARLLLTMCAYHDTGRICDYLDGAHGLRSAEKLAALSGLRGEDLLEAEACVEAHSVPDGRMEEILAARKPENLPRARMLARMLKDSDGLDRVRIHDLNVDYLRFPASRERGSFAQKLFDRYVSLERARGLAGEAEGFELSVIQRVKALVSDGFAAGESCIDTAMRTWDELTGERLAPSLKGSVPESETCGMLTAARKYFGVLFTRQGLGEAEIGEMCRVFADRFRSQYGTDVCAELKPKSGCGAFAVDAVLFACQYLYEENKKKINGVGNS